MMDDRRSQCPVLEVRDLAKSFTLHLRQGQRLPVLQGVSLRVHAGDCVALVGASGQGKSTLLKCLYGSYGADAGSMRLQLDHGAVDLAQATPQQLIGLRRREIAYVSQFLRVLPRVPAIDVIAERVLQAGPPLTAHDEAERSAAARAAAAAMLESLNLPQALWSLPPATFSGGEQQRINIARGFVVPARLLLLDEPTASLDAMNRRAVIALIHRARAAGSAVVGVFHDEEVRDAVATHRIDIETAAAAGVPA